MIVFGFNLHCVSLMCWMIREKYSSLPSPAALKAETKDLPLYWFIVPDMEVRDATEM